jgi:hypothetical protein
MQEQRKFGKLIYFLLGVLLTVSLAVLTGAYDGEQSYVGRYQVSSWSADGIGAGAFVVDTTTGETKMVYLNSDMEKQNHLGMPFNAF